MLPLFLWFLCAFGFCYAVGHARVSLGFRTRLAIVSEWLTSLLECPACLGFWVGLAGGAALPELLPAPFSPTRLVAAPVLGFATCAVGYLLGRATGWLQETEEALSAESQAMLNLNEGIAHLQVSPCLESCGSLTKKESQTAKNLSALQQLGAVEETEAGCFRSTSVGGVLVDTQDEETPQ